MSFALIWPAVLVPSLIVASVILEGNMTISSSTGLIATAISCVVVPPRSSVTVTAKLSAPK